MFAGWFDHGKAAVLEQEREESGMAPHDFGFQRMTVQELVDLMVILKLNPKPGKNDKAECVMKVEAFFKAIQQGKVTFSKSGSSSSNDGATSSDPHGIIIAAIQESRDAIIAEVKHQFENKEHITTIKHYHLADSKEASESGSSDKEASDGGSSDNAASDDGKGKAATTTDIRFKNNVIIIMLFHFSLAPKLHSIISLFIATLEPTFISYVFIGCYFGLLF